MQADALAKDGEPLDTSMDSDGEFTEETMNRIVYANARNRFRYFAPPHRICIRMGTATMRSG